MSNGLQNDPGPAKGIEPIDISSADAVFVVPPRSIYVGTGGDIIVDGLKRDGTPVTNVAFRNFPDGRELPVSCVTKVYRSGTTASDLVALY